MKQTEVRARTLDLLNRYGTAVAPISRPPVPAERIAKWCGVRVVYRPLDDELSGMISIREGSPIVGVNSQHHPNRQRFTIAHELGHFVLHRRTIEDRVHVDKKFQILMRSTKSASGTERIEIEANRFAAELLMPLHLLEPLLSRHDIDDDEPLQRLARTFRVSRQALEFRIRHLTSETEI